MPRTKQINGDKPVTQQDLSLWGGRLQEQLNDAKKDREAIRREMRTGFRKNDERFKKLEGMMKLMLKIVQGIDKEHQEQKKLRIPKRVAGLEDDMMQVKGDLAKITRKLTIT